MGLGALPSLAGEQRLDPADLGVVIAILADDLRQHASFAVDHQLRSDQMIKSQTAGYGFGVKFIGCGNQHQLASFRAVRFHLLDRLFVTVGAQDLVRETLYMRLQ